MTPGAIVFLTILVRTVTSTLLDLMSSAWTDRRARGVLIRSVALCLAVAAVLLAGPYAIVTANGDSVAVRLDGDVLFRVHATAEVDAVDRAERIERRLRTLLDRPDTNDPAVIERGPGTDERTIRVAGATIVTVTADDAEEELTGIDELAAAWASRIDDALERGRTLRNSPLERFVSEVRFSVTTAFARLGESAITILPRLLAAALVLAFFWLLATVVRRGLRAIFRRIIADLTIENLLKQLAYYSVWVVGLILAADALGFTPETVIAGLGLTGLALGFALKDVLSNFVSGLLILALRPFRIGDEIQIGDAEGRVERIDLRATNIRAYDGRLVVVPNSELLTSRVVNNTASPVRRAVVAVTLDHAADLRQAADVLLASTEHVDGVLDDPPASVRLGSLSIDGITVESRFWTDSRRSDFVTTVSAVRGSIVEGLRQAGVPLPRPNVIELEPSEVSSVTGAGRLTERRAVPRQTDLGTHQRTDGG